MAPLGTTGVPQIYGLYSANRVVCQVLSTDNVEHNPVETWNGPLGNYCILSLAAIDEGSSASQSLSPSQSVSFDLKAGYNSIDNANNPNSSTSVVLNPIPQASSESMLADLRNGPDKLAVAVTAVFPEATVDTLFGRISVQASCQADWSGVVNSLPTLVLFAMTPPSQPGMAPYTCAPAHS